LKHKSEKGFTLIEVIVALAITGIIVPVMAMSTTTLLTNNQRAIARNIVLQQVQNVGYWISRDIQTAKNVTLTEPGGFPLTLVIPDDANEGNDYSVEYLFDGSKLRRQVYDSSHTLTAEIMVAEYIEVANTTFNNIPETNSYEITVKASIGGVVVARSYQVRQRLSPS
jgi:prepilin-type N-terminal cleavage/methylation domain-containing protein